MLDQHPQRLFEQIVEIHRVRRLLLLLVARVHILDLFEQREEVRKLFRQECIDRRLGVDDETENLREHVTFREPDFLRIDPGRCDHGIDQVLLIFAVHDAEAARIPQRASVPAEHPVSDRVKRAAPEPTRIHRQEIRHAVEHLARGLVRESEEQDVARINPVLEQIRHAIRERPRLAAPRARDHQQGPRRCCDGRELLLIQLRRVIDIDRRRMRGALERILPGHAAIPVAAVYSRRNFIVPPPRTPQSTRDSSKNFRLFAYLSSSSR